MDRLTLLAFMVWAIDRDLLHCPVPQAWKLFQKYAVRYQKYYVDHTDMFPYCKDSALADPIKFMTDYVLTYAKCSVVSGVWTYGKYDERILNYSMAGN